MYVLVYSLLRSIILVIIIIMTRIIVELQGLTRNFHKHSLVFKHFWV